MIQKNNYNSIPQEKKEKIDTFFENDFKEHGEAYEKLASPENDKDTEDLENFLI